MAASTPSLGVMSIWTGLVRWWVGASVWIGAASDWMRIISYPQRLLSAEDSRASPCQPLGGAGSRIR